MFGYVMANGSELDKAQRKRYGAVYCGICRRIRDTACNTARLGLSCLAGACAESEEASGALALQPGNALHGFTVTEVYPSRTLSSTIYTFTHAVSGATLVYVENDDPEVAFSIGYHTPYVDETDTNHVFEHAILSGSEKYPSKNLYVDLAGRVAVW